MVLDIKLPTSWSELKSDELRLVFRLFARNLSSPEVKAICTLRWNKIKVISRTNNPGEYFIKFKKQLLTITAREMFNITRTLDFMDDIPNYPVRYACIGRNFPLPADFEGVPFEQYIYADNLFQGYLHTEQKDLLKEMLKILYRTSKQNFTDDECIMAFYWFASLKSLFARRFSYFYQPIGQVQQDNMLEGKSLHQKLTDAVNAQIRALTGGDVTKEPFVMKMDTIRALTELDAKAYEAEELKKQSKK